MVGCPQITASLPMGLLLCAEGILMRRGNPHEQKGLMQYVISCKRYHSKKLFGSRQINGNQCWRYIPSFLSSKEHLHHAV